MNRRGPPVPQTDAQRRASRAVAAWLAHHQRNPAWLVRTAEADPGTIGDFLKGVRWPKYRTQGKIEQALGWEAGTITAIADGGSAPPLAERTEGGVGAVSNDEDTLLYRRPPGLADDEWERLKTQTRDWIEWQLDRAAGER